jgi:hypothetical protein
MEIFMRKTLMVVLAAGSIGAATVASSTRAEATCWGCWVGAGVVAGVIAGTAIANSAPYYGYGGYYGAPYAYQRPAYFGPAYYGYYRPYRPYYGYSGYAYAPRRYYAPRAYGYGYGYAPRRYYYY